MNNPILKIERLSHRYSSSWAIRDINIEISRAGITGLLGSNGAGKSTTMNILCGVLNQTEGQVFIDGIDMRKDPEAAKKLLGFLPQTPPLYMDLTVDEYLTFCALLRLMEKRKVKAALVRGFAVRRTITHPVGENCRMHGNSTICTELFGNGASVSLWFRPISQAIAPHCLACPR